MIEFAVMDSVADRLRFMFRKNCRSRVALAFSVIPILMISWQIQFDLSFLQFGFLDAKEIGIKFFKDFAKIFFKHGS